MHWQTELEEHILTETTLATVFAYMCNLHAASSRLPAPEGDSTGQRDNKVAKVTTEGKKAHTANSRKQSPNVCLDPVSAMTMLMISDPVQFILGETGMSLFKNHTRYVFPYRLMNAEQRESICRCISHREEWSILNAHMVFKEPAHSTKSHPYRLPTLLCLKAMCTAVTAATPRDKEEDGLTTCNIVLQRVQTIIPNPAVTHTALNQWMADRHTRAD